MKKKKKTNQTAQFFLYLGLRFSRPLSRDIHEIYTVENICRIYGRIHVAGYQLPGQVPLVYGNRKNYLALQDR